MSQLAIGCCDHSYFSCDILQGMYSTLISVALPDLRDRLEITTEEITRVMSLKSIGGLAGGFSGGAFMDRFRDRSHLFIAAALMACGIGTMLQPWSTYMEVLGLLYTVEGICQGIYDTGQSHGSLLSRIYFLFVHFISVYSA